MCRGLIRFSITTHHNWHYHHHTTPQKASFFELAIIRYAVGSTNGQVEVTTILRPNDYHENHSGGSTSVVDPLQEQGIRHNFTQFVPLTQFVPFTQFVL